MTIYSEKVFLMNMALKDTMLDFSKAYTGLSPIKAPLLIEAPLNF